MEIILIVASSDACWHSCKKCRLEDLVIDLFADLDTPKLRRRFPPDKITSRTRLAPNVDEFVERYAVAYVIYGSGFEYFPESLGYLCSRLMLIGNHPDVLRGCRISKYSSQHLMI